jgi:metallo-beta-lactamase class B
MKILISALLPLISASAPAAETLTASINCGDCARWNEARDPVRLYGESWYVGVGGLSSVLIASQDGLVLIDGDLPQSAPLIEANIAKLGLKVADIKVILVSHEHFDHVGGVAAVQKDSGARVLAGAEAAKALTRGHPTEADPQYQPNDPFHFPAVKTVETVQDGQVLRLGNLAITAHRTPGHTPGSTSWSWQSCDEGKCLNLVYADSLTAVTTNGYRFSSIASSYRASIAKVRDLPCDILISTHPSASSFWERVEKHALIDPNACRAYADNAERNLDRRLAEENSHQ